MNRSQRSLILGLVPTLLLLGSGLAGAAEPEYMGASASWAHQLDCPAPARELDPFMLTWLVQGLEDKPGFERELSCSLEARNGGEGVRGVRVTLDAEIIDLDGNTLADLPRRRGRSNRGGYRAIDFSLGSVAAADFGVVIQGNVTGGRQVDSVHAVCTARYRRPCTADATTLCLQGDRFKATVNWDNGSQSGAGMVMRGNNTEGTFYFLNPNQQEVLMRVLNNCGTNDHFWVFYGAATPFEYELTVTDTQSGEIRTYGNPLGQPAPAVTDTAAFATCP